MNSKNTPFAVILEEAMKLGGTEMSTEWSREEQENINELREIEAIQQQAEELNEANSRRMFFVRRS
jgi:hypothetical protein